ncbi:MULTISPECIES: EcsC family protein [Nostocales]|uniref:EcsC family protein n=3 Tax=Nostocales TaxID=1161 RepID=A0A0C1QQR1_9CYAN|nr:EcsC family protein [Tolypothrix bouteillei]KAF3888632.1 EcsC family protein [Tolypothrix bouteillei VB521301]
MADKKQQSHPPTNDKEDKPSLLESVAETLGCAVGTAVGVGAAASSVAVEASKAVAETAAEVGEAAVKQTHNLIEQATHTAGQVANYLGENWLIRKLSGVLNLNWLLGASDNVNLEKAAAAVKKLQLEHPNESPSQISHRIMVEKAAMAGGIGLATSVLPGFAAALLAIDLAATTELQSEMVYQIAAAYGLDLKDPARKGEVLAIFGLALGGGRLLKTAGLGLLRNVPFAGAVIGASSNATMIYSLGYAACRFYETKIDISKSLSSEETLAELKQESENYLEKAIAQEAVMDQILVHMILASYPEKNWEEILPELQALHLSPNSLETIAQNIKSPQSLDTLTNQLNRDFAIPVLAQCYRIARSQNEITSTEQNIINAIASKFNIDVNRIKSLVDSGVGQ